MIKLLGNGEYIAEAPGKPAPGHFGLAVRDYTHSTAPNRRYTDLLTQRLVKAALVNGRPPYTMDQLEGLADHCTQLEDAANKVERQVEKSAAALLLEHRVGEQFDALVTGASEKGTWARLLGHAGRRAIGGGRRRAGRGRPGAGAVGGSGRGSGVH